MNSIGLFLLLFLARRIFRRGVSIRDDGAFIEGTDGPFMLFFAEKALHPNRFQADDGTAMDLPGRKVWWSKHMVKPGKLLQSKNLA